MLIRGAERRLSALAPQAGTWDPSLPPAPHSYRCKLLASRPESVVSAPAGSEQVSELAPSSRPFLAPLIPAQLTCHLCPALKFRTGVSAKTTSMTDSPQSTHVTLSNDGSEHLFRITSLLSIFPCPPFWIFLPTFGCPIAFLTNSNSHTYLIANPPSSPYLRYLLSRKRPRGGEVAPHPVA